MSGAPQADDDLIARTATGDRAAFAALVERHGRAVLTIGRALGRNEADAQDIAQETFLSALRAASTYRPGVASVRSWLFAIARNAGRRTFTRRNGREILSDTLDDEGPLLDLGIAAGWGTEATDSTLERYEDLEELARAIASLSVDDREILVLRDIEALSGEETAEVLGLATAAMKSRLHRARLRLMAALRASEGGIVANERDVGGIACSAVLERLGEYVDRELPASEVAKVDAHLRGCTVCERFGGRYGRTVHAARTRLGAEHAIDDATLERVRTALGLA